MPLKYSNRLVCQNQPQKTENQRRKAYIFCVVFFKTIFKFLNTDITQLFAPKVPSSKALLILGFISLIMSLLAAVTVECWFPVSCLSPSALVVFDCDLSRVALRFKCISYKKGSTQGGPSTYLYLTIEQFHCKSNI